MSVDYGNHQNNNSLGLKRKDATPCVLQVENNMGFKSLLKNKIEIVLAEQCTI